MPGAKLSLRLDAVAWTPTNNESVVVLDFRTSRYLSLNSSGSLLWNGIVDGATESDLQNLLAGRFGLTENAARADVEAFLDDLRGRDLLVD